MTPRYKIPPYRHQEEAVARLVEMVEPEIGRVIPRVMLNADEMRLGKTKTSIDAAQVLFERGEIDRALVITLNSAKKVWFDPDPEFGEIARNTWDDLPVEAFWVHSTIRRWDKNIKVSDARRLIWFVTNYDFVRLEDRLPSIIKLCDEKTLLVLDESSAIGNWKSLTSKAIHKIRARCGWVWELNGTPIGQSPATLFNQAKTLSPRILGYETWWQFIGHHAIKGGFKGKQIMAWRNIDVLQERMKPYVIRRLKIDCLDLPPKLPSVTLTATLTKDSWAVYKEMRDEFVVYLTSLTTASAAQSGVRTMRLCQLTSGFLAGIQTARACASCRADGTDCAACDGVGLLYTAEPPREVGREKLDIFLESLDEAIAEKPDLKFIVWCRFRHELARVAKEIAERGIKVHTLWGSNTREERDATLTAFHPRTAVRGAAGLVGTMSTGAKGLNLAAATSVYYLSHDPSLENYLQSGDRPHGPGQTEPVSYTDIITEGPAGQSTVDRVVLKQLRARRDLAEMTTSAWVTALMEEQC